MASLQGFQAKAVGVLCVLLLLVAVLPAGTKHASGKKASGTSVAAKGHSASKSSKSTSREKSSRIASVRGKKGKRGKAVARRRGQQAIDEDRTREIQEALIREHYLEGEPTGMFDQRTKDALTQFQNDNGWQTKIVPDSRALIKLGLGPSHEGLLNPDSAALGNPHQLGAEREVPGGAVLHK